MKTATLIGVVVAVTAGTSPILGLITTSLLYGAADEVKQNLDPKVRAERVKEAQENSPACQNARYQYKSATTLNVGDAEYKANLRAAVQKACPAA